MRKRDLTFVYDANWPGVGSTVMRGMQLSGIAREALGSSRTVGYLPLSPALKRSDLFLTKNAAMALDSDSAAALVSRGNRLFVDIVDAPPPPWARAVAAVIVTASISSYIQVSRDYPDLETVLVNHHTDPRLPKPAPRAQFRVGYFGELFNAYRTPAINERVDFIGVDTASQHPAWLDELPGYTLHYAIRQRIAQDAIKPFLKGFTAAACGAAVIAAAGDPEAVAWLGSDYPYLVPEDTESSVVAVLDEARADFGSPRWAQAMDVMRGIAIRTSPERIGRELVRAVAR